MRPSGPDAIEDAPVSYAIIATGGKQHKVTVGDRLRVELLDAVVGDSVTFDKVLAVKSGDDLKVGRPILTGARVVAKVVEQGKGPKVRIFKKKRTKQYRRTRGHRQGYTAVVVEEIHAG
jgi:large subunit ribosomal protein L21